MVEVRGLGEVSRSRLAAEEEVEIAVAGEYLGDTVEIEKDPLSLVEDLKEELGTAVAEELETELGREERRLDRLEDNLEIVMEGEVDGDAGDLSDLKQRKDEIEALGQAIKDRGLSNPDDILQYLEDNLGPRQGEDGPNDDPTLQYGALSIIARMFEGRGDGDMAAAVKAASQLLLSREGTTIAKGMIVSEAAALHSSEACGSVSELRSLYMDEVVGHQGIPATFNSLMEKYGDAGFPEAVAFLLRAAGDDLSRMTRDTDKVQQKEVIDNLYQMEVLNTVRERTDGVLKQIGKHFPVAPDSSTQKVMRDTFGMISQPIRLVEQNVTKLARETIPDSIEGRISFLREYRTLCNIIPLKVFEEADGGNGLRLREKMAEAIVAAQDVADAEEQEKLAQ